VSARAAAAGGLIGLVWTALVAVLNEGRWCLFVETTHGGNTKRTGVECSKGRACHKKENISCVRRATATGIKVLLKALWSLLSTTYHQGPTGMAGLGRGRQRASQRGGQIKQRKLAETPKNNKETLGTHACTCARHARTIALHACGPIRHSHLIVSLMQRQSGLVYVRGCVEIGFCCFTHRSDGDCETLPATQNLSLTLAGNLVLP